MPSSVELFFDVDEIVSGLDKAPSILSQQFLPKQKGVEYTTLSRTPPLATQFGRVGEGVG